ncbi:MAG: diacylglycerol kinase family lipid kinase [Actinobacteria bacterium]|nr:diacylglycerol kinase family lipid kinase [Actinomycetota bacterium]
MDAAPATTVGLIYNPAAGGGKAADVGKEVRRRLEWHGARVLVRTTSAPTEAFFIAAELVGQVDSVVAVGGDGTVNEVVNGLANRDVPLGIVPAGTVNVLALELGLPFDVGKACEVILRGHTTTLDLGRVDGRRFTLMVGAGIDALTVRELDPRAKRRFRELAFVWTGLRSYLRTPPVDFGVVVDGRRHRASYVVVGNCRYYGGRFGLTSRADPTDGVLDVLMYEDTGFGHAMAFVLGIPFGLHVRHPGVTYVRGRHVVLEAPDDGVVWFQTDGELAGRLPAVVEIERHALRVFAPDRARHAWEIPTPVWARPRMDEEVG